MSMTMGRDELFARVEVLKMAARAEMQASEIAAAATALWAFASDGRKIASGCGCGDKGKAVKPEDSTFTGTHVVPFSWTRSASDASWIMWVMDLPLFTVIQREKELVELHREGYDARAFTGEHALKNCMQFANDQLVGFLNANVETVRDWIKSKDDGRS